MSYSVGEVASFASVTVRTLHHYDEIGLLSPGGRSHAGHRRYDDADLDRLQQILFYRELGFPLDEVAALLDGQASGETDPQAHLRRQHELLTVQIEKLQKMAEAVEHAMEARKMGINLTPEEKFEVFGEYDPERYEEESRRRWGDSEPYRESQRRVATYTKEDWLRIKAEGAGNTNAFAALMEAAVAPDSESAMDLAEQHRQQISRNFYDCTYEIHTGLAEMYVADERFSSTFEQIRPGLAGYLRAAILANAARRS
ncbi:MerR family transcriptional regulator [Streptomyces sp. NPDC001820]|uniref:MerR family transcriptional regulator n=1 Tax=Streptomyces sp. NPDC001820 TaxID=3364613 RepID=UPI0036C2C120